MHESLVNDHEELLLTDLAGCKQKLANLLVFSNAHLPTMASDKKRLAHASFRTTLRAKGIEVMEHVDFWAKGFILIFKPRKQALP